MWSDVEIIGAIRLSDPTLEATPTGVLSIIAHYSRPNVYTFSKPHDMYLTTYHYSAEGPLITTTSYEGKHLGRLHSISYIIGVVGDNIYLTGFSAINAVISSFNMCTRTFTFRGYVEHPSCTFVLSSECFFVCGGINNNSFWRRNLITGEETALPDMIVDKMLYGHYFYRDSVYIFGGRSGDRTLRDCERFDVKENKWYKLPLMPRAGSDIRVIEKDGCLILVTIEEWVFSYSPEKNTWTTLEWDEHFMKLSLESFQYNRGRFWAISEPTNYDSTTIWESTTPEKPWNPILKRAKVNRGPKVHTFLHLMDE